MKIERLVKEFLDLDGKQIEISGGEPIEHPNIFDILRLMHIKHISPSVYTTGIRMVDNVLKPIDIVMAKKLSEYVRSLVFSIQGGDAEIHDSFTRMPGSFEATISAIKACKEAGIDNIFVHFVPTQLNYRSLPSLVSLLQKIKVGRVSLLRFVPHGRGYGSSLALNSSQNFELRNMIELISKKQVTVRLGTPYSIFQIEGIPYCHAGLDRMLVAPDGTAYPCDAYKGYAFPGDEYNNVYTVGLKKVWTKSKFFIIARRFTKRVPTQCKGCEFEDTCHGGCPAQRAFAYSIGNPDKLDAFHADPGCLQCPSLF